MHMVSRKDLNKAELETVRISKNPMRGVRKFKEICRVDRRKPKTQKNDDNEEVRGNLSHDLPEWLQDRSSSTVW